MIDISWASLVEAVLEGRLVLVVEAERREDAGLPFRALALTVIYQAIIDAKGNGWVDPAEGRETRRHLREAALRFLLSPDFSFWWGAAGQELSVEEARRRIGRIHRLRLLAKRCRDGGGVV